MLITFRCRGGPFRLSRFNSILYPCTGSQPTDWILSPSCLEWVGTACSAPNSTCYLTSNSGSAFGRFLPGMLSDRFGRFNTISAMILLTIVLIFVLWYPFGRFVGVLYPFAFLFGFGTGSIISLTPVCVGQICKTEEFGKWFGTCYFVVSFG